MKYLYESHLGNLYISDDYISNDELYCEKCSDSDWLLGQFDSIEEFWNLIEDKVDIRGSGGYALQYIYPIMVAEFELDDKLDFDNDRDWPLYCTWDDERIIGRIEELLDREIPLSLIEKENFSALLTNNIKKENSYLLGPLEYSKTPEEIMEEIRAIEAAINFLDSFGVVVKTEYGCYRSTYEILKDLGEHITTWQK